ncbi:MAG TPA: hypothetical protein VMA32_08880 [Streptosporangiaceae bacterium]|nr:hypothetical protein [Streptosporangiaceae bacterium]
MTVPDASSGEMPRVPFPGLTGRDHDEVLLDMILDRRTLPPDAPPGMHALAANLVGLAALPGGGDLPGGGELPGEAAALAAFRRSGSPASTLTLAGEAPEHRRRRLTAARARLSAAIAVLTVVLSGTAAAYAGALPTPVQDFAHRIIDAPAAHRAGNHPHAGLSQRAHHHGVGPSSPAPSHSPHPAKPGQQKKAHRGAQHRGHQGKGKGAKKPKPTHPAHPAHPAHG